MLKKLLNQNVKSKKDDKKKREEERAQTKLEQEGHGGCCGVCHEPKEPKKKEK